MVTCTQATLSSSGRSQTGTGDDKIIYGNEPATRSVCSNIAPHPTLRATFSSGQAQCLDKLEPQLGDIPEAAKFTLDESIESNRMPRLVRHVGLDEV